MSLSDEYLVLICIDWWLVAIEEASGRVLFRVQERLMPSCFLVLMLCVVGFLQTPRLGYATFKDYDVLSHTVLYVNGLEITL
jgi:hypothetical protein